MAQPAAQTDRDLASIAEARALVRRAKAVAPVLADLSQEQIDAIVDAMAAAATPQAEALARLACDETGYGVVADKIQKNLFASQKIYNFIKPMKTVGVVRRIEEKKVIEIAEPFGVVAAIVPTTNPTSTALYKILISLKARCPIVISPHPSAVRCITRSAEVMNEAARRAGAPDGAINWMTQVTIEGTQELMKARETAVILATGGMGLVRAAYSAGKPAYGVGPGNAPAYIERTADVAKAVRDIVTGKTFDNGLLCSSENSVVVDAPLVDEVKRQFVANGAYFLAPAEIEALGKILVTPQRLPNPALVGKPATYVAQQAGITVPPGHAGADRGTGRSGSRLPAVHREALPRPLLLCRKRLERGMRAVQADPPIRGDGPHDVDSLHERGGHSPVRAQEAGVSYRREHPHDPRIDRLHDLARSVDDARVWRMGRQHHVRQHLPPPPAEHQAVGVGDLPGTGSARARQPVLARETAPRPALPALPRTAPAPVTPGIAAESLARRIDQFLASRGYTATAPAAPKGIAAPVEEPSSAGPEASCACASPRTGHRLRMRGGRQAGDPPGPQNCHRRTHNRYAGGPGSCRAASGLRSGRLAYLRGYLGRRPDTLGNARKDTVTVESVGFKVDPQGAGCYSACPSNF